MIARLLFRLSLRRFLHACEDPFAAQMAVLRRVLRQAARTEIGRRADFAGLSRMRDGFEMLRLYRERVPIRSFEEMRADLEAVHAGDWQRLCPSAPIYFAMTAGSSGRFKHLPVTRELRRDIGRGSLIFYGALEAACPALRDRRAQFLVGSAEGGASPAGVPQGFASGFNYKNLPGFVRRRFVLPYWIFTLPDAEERAYAAGRWLVEQRDLGALCAISPVNLINLHAALERHVGRLCEDLRRGTLTVRGPSAVPGEFVGRPNAALATEVATAWLRHGKLPREVLFPSLATLVCWRGGSMGYYLDELADRFGRCDVLEFPLSASEGVFAIPTEPNVTGGLAAVTSHFLEFVPVDGPGDRDAPATALRVDQLRVGGSYRLVVTTSGGLYRYDMQDIVEVRAIRGSTPVLAFVSRRDRQVSVANERITEQDVTVAMTEAARVTGVRVREFLFVPCRDRRYRLLLDGDSLEPAREQGRGVELQRLAGEVERQLRRTATGYDFERDDALLEPLELAVTRPGELRAFLRAGGGPAGLPNAQVKPVHLTPEFDAHHHFARLVTYAA